MISVESIVETIGPRGLTTAVSAGRCAQAARDAAPAIKSKQRIARRATCLTRSHGRSNPALTLGFSGVPNTFGPGRFVGYTSSNVFPSYNRPFFITYRTVFVFRIS